MSLFLHDDMNRVEKTSCKKAQKAQKERGVLIGLLLSVVLFCTGPAYAQKAPAPTPASNGPEIGLSRGQPVTTDGKIDEKEWQSAASFELKGGGKVFFRYDGTYLYVGVRGTGNGWSHLYLSRGDGVLVHHASAALGLTTYRPDKDQKWQPSNPFAWDLRDRVITAETQKKMDDHLSKNFWVANNNNMGARNEIEFKIKPQTSSIRVAVVYATDAKDPQFFPDTLRDDTLKEDLVRGNTPPDLKFETGQWANIIFEEKTK